MDLEELSIENACALHRALREACDKAVRDLAQLSAGDPPSARSPEPATEEDWSV